MVTPDTLRAARDRAGLTAAALGEKLGLSHVQVVRIENGTRGTDYTTVNRWLEACGVRLTIVVDETQQTPDAQLLRRLAAILPHVPEDRRDVLLAQIELWERLHATALFLSGQ